MYVRLQTAADWYRCTPVSLLCGAGQGVQRLGDSWHPLQAGDAVWMAPYVPQWYAALGKTSSRYVLYKDTVLDPLL
jgi:(S)-ureidoglycine aminohydrolase